MNDDEVVGVKDSGGTLRFAYDAYSRFVIMVRQLQKITDQPLVGSLIRSKMNHLIIQGDQ